MTEQEIKDGNKLIAEFMGARLTLRNNELAVYLSENAVHAEYFRVTQYNKYHSSWDALMPVVEKIESLPKINAAVDINKNVVIVSIEDGVILFHGNVFLDNNKKINTVFLAVVSFVKWYNENK